MSAKVISWTIAIAIVALGVFAYLAIVACVLVVALSAFDVSLAFWPAFCLVLLFHLVSSGLGLFGRG